VVVVLTVERVVSKAPDPIELLGTAELDGSQAYAGPKLPSGRSAAILEVNRLIAQVAPYDSSVLLLGESGTGKEVVARAIHEASARRQRPFVAVNCGAIPAELLESELFGHEKGAFTGAINTRKGRFEIAEGGTLFLDEIGDMSLPMQVKLLRVLQERSFERVGSNLTTRCDVRIIAATHRNLEEHILRGAFRGDLYYRLNVFPIEMPTLKSRIEDLDLLIEDFAATNARGGRGRVMFTAATIAALAQYAWPGNVRELANLVERMSILCPDRPVSIGDLPARYRPTDWSPEAEIQLNTPPCALQTARFTEISARQSPSVPDDLNEPEDMATTCVVSTEWLAAPEQLMSLPNQGIDLRAHLLTIERSLISQALERADGTVAHAARLLNLRRTTLVEKLRKLGMVAA
jgi:sigma-54 dependent transcriptional regulator, flagellar regulatory protein